VTLVGLTTIVVALGLAVRHRRQVLDIELSAPITQLEPAQDR